MPTVAEKHPANPVLAPGAHGAFDAKRAGNWAGDIHWDAAEGVFKAWYYGSDIEGTPAIGYATSENGVLWEKPRLGMYEFGGSSDNNITFMAEHSQTSHFCLLIDPDAESERRYQALGWSAQPGIEGMRNYPYYSADGIHWKVTPTPENAVAVGDTSDVIIDSQEMEPERRVKVYTQQGVWFGPDIEHLQEAPRPAIDPADGREHEIHFVHAIPYDGRYVMLYDFDSVIQWPHGMAPEGTRARRQLPAGAYAGDCRLAVGDDGLVFRRVRPDRPVIPMGTWGAWDDELLVLGGGSIIPFDDRIVLFYTALSHFGRGFLMPGPYYKCEMGMATLRPHGFSHLRNADGLTRATATTRVIRAAADGDTAGGLAQLKVNVSHLLPYRDWIEVEVLDAASGGVLPGYGREDCRHIVEEGLDVVVSWQEHSHLPAGNNVKLRFYLWGAARLYSYRITE